MQLGTASPHRGRSASDDSWAEYAPVRPPAQVAGIIAHLEAQFRRHALLSWVFVPCFTLAVSGLFVKSLGPTCSSGFNDLTLVPLILLELHHLYAESCAWGSIKQLLAPPELCVLRQYGVLQKRRWFVLLGILEGLDLFTDLMFPWVARACDPLVTEHWVISWKEVPIMGSIVAHVLRHFHFWGCAIVGLTLNVLVTGLWGLAGLARHERIRERSLSGEEEQPTGPRLSAELFFAWARSASTAMMPSVAVLCEELADQKKWVYDRKKDAKDATQGREKLAYGKINLATQQQLELQNLDEQARVQRAAQKHYVKMLVAKVFLGNVLSLWLQSSFLALTFESSGPEAREKVIFSMAVSAVTACVRCVRVTGRMGTKGLSLSAVILFFVAWTALKVYYAYECPDHLWNLSTFSCVSLVKANRPG